MESIHNPKSAIRKIEEAAEAYGIADTSYSTQAAFLDYDLDGDLDLYVLNHANERATLNTPLPKKTQGEGSSNDHFYRNNGTGKGFTDITKEAGIMTEGYGLGIAVSDFNGDGWPDVYIANDFIYNDLLWINENGKRFSNQVSSYFGHQTYNSMGCDVADFNNDARPDLITVDMLPETDSQQKMMAGAMTWDKWQLIAQAGYEPQYMRNSLQMAVDGGRLTVDGGVPSTVNRLSSTGFSEIGQLAGVAATDWSWAPLFADFDNDGWKDLFISNGYLRDITDKDFMDYSNNLSMFKSQVQADQELLPKISQLKGKKLPNRIFQNHGNLDFYPQNEAWGLSQASCSNGAAYADLDNDGDLDLVTNNLNEPAFVYENKADKLLKNNYLNIRLEGTAGNPSGSGASVLMVSGGQRQYFEQQQVRGFMSAVSGVLHIGLGDKKTVDSLEIRWRDGQVQVLTDVTANQVLTLKQEDARPLAQAPDFGNLKNFRSLMQDVTGQHGIDFTHQELLFNDFQYQPLLPHGFSENGPPIAVGDLNGDGLEDFYVGGGKGQAGRIFYQKNDGNFANKDLIEGSESEDTAALIFDVNGDGKNDLYVVSGSSEWAADSPFYQDRLYLNTGNGSLAWVKNALPKMHTPGNCAAAADYDGDGDLDLFVGGSAEPGSYPTPARSYLLRNDGGKFTDVTASISSGLEKPGIITAAQWADLDKDGSPDLVLVGEWMPITVFAHQKGRFTNATKSLGLEHTTGWWSSLAIHDLDGDGDLDVVAGNLGLNTKFRASEASPLTIYAKDFDHNGSVDAITCRYTEGKEKPIHQRDELLAQINGMEKKYPRYALYADASVQEIFGEKALSNAMRLDCKILQSTVFTNEAGKHFTAKPLPVQAQFAPINAIISGDFDGDGHADLLLAGNTWSRNISAGQCDASHGLLLNGDGQAGFVSSNVNRSGFYVDGAVASMAQVKLKSGGSLLLVGVNGAPLQVFERKNEAQALGKSVSSSSDTPTSLDTSQFIFTN
ncbi:MAG: VCBS repeat-containing protein [Saprospiraceae bacterium]|nr:VCBS repeat-containing protein [Saprospiraceae bacterium]